MSSGVSNVEDGIPADDQINGSALGTRRPLRLLKYDLGHVIHTVARYGDGRAVPPFSNGQTLLPEEDVDESIIVSIRISRNGTSTTLLFDLLLRSNASHRTTHDAKVQGGLAGANGDLLSSVGNVGIGYGVIRESLFLYLTCTRGVVVVNAGVGIGESLEDGLVEMEIVPKCEIRARHRGIVLDGVVSVER